MKFTTHDVEDIREAARYSLAISQGVRLVSPVLSVYVRHHEQLALRLERLAQAAEEELNAPADATKAPPEGPA